MLIFPQSFFIYGIKTNQIIVLHQSVNDVKNNFHALSVGRIAQQSILLSLKWLICFTTV